MCLPPEAQGGGDTTLGTTASLLRRDGTRTNIGAVLFRLLLPHLPKRIEVAIDDTLCRRGGPRIFGVSMHRDGAASSYSGSHSSLACGHSWVVLAVLVPLPWSDRRLSVPILARLYRSPKRCSGSEYQKRTELARSLTLILASLLPSGRTLHLTGDREYACRTLLRDLDREIQFTGPMPMNAMLFGPVPRYAGIGRPRCRGKRLPNPKARARSVRGWAKLQPELYGRKTKLLVKTWTCLWYTATGQRLIRVVLTRDPKGNYADRAFFSTEHELAPEVILDLYSRRWLIEVSFRDAKQHLGLNDPQNGWSRGKRSKARAWAAAARETRTQGGRADDPVCMGGLRNRGRLVHRREPMETRCCPPLQEISVTVA